MYNAEKFITELLSCFDLEDDFNYQIIIIDDGSKDNSFEVCGRFKSNKIRLFHQENQGVSATRNNIIKMADSTWITFVDADDLINYSLYKSVFLNIVNKSKSNYIVNTKSNVPSKYINSQIKYCIENEIINSPWSKFYKVNILKKYNIEFNRSFYLGEDLLFNLTYLSNCQSLEIINYDLYEARTVNDSSLTRKYTPNKINMLLGVLDECKNLDLPDNTQFIFNYIKIKNFYSSIIDMIKFTDTSKKNIILKIKEFKKKSKFKFLKLSNFKHVLFYYSWFILPSRIIYYVLNNRFKKGI